MMIEPTSIFGLLSQGWRYVALQSAIELDLFSYLDGKPKPVEALASELALSAVKLGPLLHALVAAGILEKSSEGFANGAEAREYLSRDSPHYCGEFFAHVWRAHLATATTIRSGKGSAAPDLAAMPEAKRKNFLDFWHAASESALLVDELAEHLDFPACRKILDLGGGTGGLSIALCKRQENLRCTVSELPIMAKFAETYIEEAGLSDRIEVHAADATSDPLPQGFDLVILRSFVQALSASEAAAAIRNASHCLVEGGEIAILGGVLEDSRLAPIELVGYNLIYINVYPGGQAYTESEYKAWLSAAGFGDPRISRLRGGSGLVRASKPKQG